MFWAPFIEGRQRLRWAAVSFAGMAPWESLRLGSSRPTSVMEPDVNGSEETATAERWEAKGVACGSEARVSTFLLFFTQRDFLQGRVWLNLGSLLELGVSCR